MNLFKKFIRSISQVFLYPNSKERAWMGKIYKRSLQLVEAAKNDKDLFSAMIKYLCWGIQVKLLFVFWFNEWFEQWQCWEAQMLGLLKPALMPIQGSVWSCVRLQQDQSRVMPLWGAQQRSRTISTSTAPEVCAGPRSKKTKREKLNQCVKKMHF